MARVTLRDVRKAFGEVAVVKGVSAEIGDGEFVVLVGPSGCGKSTLLRMIAGLEEVSSGVVEIDGEVVNDVASKDRDIAMVFQNYALYPHMTVAENMGFSLRLRGERREVIEERVGEAARALDVAHLLARTPRMLSGGQRQRVAMGRAIVRNPRIFLFDEPLSNLDAKLRVQMRSELRELHQRLGVTSIYVTHDQIEAMTMADRIIVLKDGLVEQVGRPLDLFDRPVNAFVAGFIGSPAMNFLAGTLEGAGLRLSDGTLLAVPAPGSLRPGARATLGIRPEHLALRQGGTGGLPAKVRVAEPTGSETMLVTQGAGQAITVLARERVMVRAGDEVSLHPDAGHAHWFDEAGQRIGA